MENRNQVILPILNILTMIRIILVLNFIKELKKIIQQFILPNLVRNAKKVILKHLLQLTQKVKRIITSIDKILMDIGHINLDAEWQQILMLQVKKL